MPSSTPAAHQQRETTNGQRLRCTAESEQERLKRQPFVHLLFPVAGALLALTTALAAACFVKAFGISFLALPRSLAAADAREVSLSMRFGMGILITACF